MGGRRDHDGVTVAGKDLLGGVSVARVEGLDDDV
jgi:hypothetical protein